MTKTGCFHRPRGGNKQLHKKTTLQTINFTTPQKTKKQNHSTIVASFLSSIHKTNDHV
jgi:hypothetical protein